MAVYNPERLTILLVEDNKFVRFTLENLLRQLQFREIMTAGNGAEAVEQPKTTYENRKTTGGAGPSTLRSGSAAAAEDGPSSVPDAPGGHRGVSPRLRYAGGAPAAPGVVARRL